MQDPIETLFLDFQRTAARLLGMVEAALAPHGLTQTQYNALRILRGAGEAGLPCTEVGQRMIHADPDITRLLDRMEKRGLVRRSRSARDRRVVQAFLEPAGAALLAALDEPVSAAVHRAMAPLDETRRRRLGKILLRLCNQTEPGASD